MAKVAKTHARLMCGAAGAALLLLMSGASAQAAEAKVEIAPQPLASALNEFGVQTGRQVIFTPSLTASKTTRGIRADGDIEVALAQLLEGSGLTYRRDEDTFLIVQGGSDPQGGSAAGGGATVEALIVTAQKREEDIQDVPIAISAFSQKDLEQQKIEGGFDLLKAIPNVTFSKNNFTSYNFSIRGIGTKAISATTDPGVAVAFNNTALIQNRLFEQEYFDVERVEVLRGPQGTLYGRNATSGVINVISAKPDMDEFEGSIRGEVGNFHAKRISAMLNVPIVSDVLAVRFAGALTDRDGYDFNAGTGNPVNGRDLWSARLTIGFNPTERIRSNFIWERFEEDDDRSRTGKQLCHRDDGPQTIGSTPVVDTPDNHFSAVMRPALFSQGCQPGSLYDDAAFGTPNGLALPFVFAMLALGDDCSGVCSPLYPLGITRDGRVQTLVGVQDPYDGMMQSRDLRTIASFRDPRYRAKADVFELNVDIDITDSLTFISQTAYNKDEVYSFQDFNRFNTVPIFNDTAQLYAQLQPDPNNPTIPSAWADLAPGGLLCDPQLGCSRSLAGFDISQGSGTQFSQEFRLQSDFDGPINFSVGANYTKFETLIDYYVMYNLITAFALMPVFNFQSDITKCIATFVDGQLTEAFDPPYLDINTPGATCPYIDPNPVESINGEGHNYFRSKNPYELSSKALFGELYWQAAETLKVTAGLRYTDDRKTFTPVPSQVLLSPFFGGGTVNRGYPAEPDIKQKWGEFTGRLGVDWKPTLSFTDQTMVYAFYSRGYKGGGANPPSIGYDKRSLGELFGIPGAPPPYDKPLLYLTAVNYGPTFRPEFVNAFEVGAKNILWGGGLVFNAGTFFYDYKDYQVSKIVDRTAVNENFDAEVWGVEFETLWQPTRDLRINANLGYLDTAIGKGAKSIDLMNRTQSNPDWVLVKPWAQLPSNCIAPRAVVENYLQQSDYVQYYWDICGGWQAIGSGPSGWFTDPETGERYTPDIYPEVNGGAGFDADLEGNELPNSPHWTMNIGAQYGRDFLEDWRVTVRGDAYWQSQSWARVYNSDPYDKLHGWYNVNLSIWFEKPDQDLKIELYAKNLLDKTPITDAFLNSDDTALTTNVFVLDPRLIGLSIRKGF